VKFSGSETLRLLPGRILVSKAPRMERHGQLILPPSAWKLAQRAFCHVHEQTVSFGEDLTNQWILVDKYAGSPLTLGGTTFWVMTQWACLALLEEGEQYYDA